MAKTEKQLMERDAKRDIGAELLQSMRDVKAGKIGNVTVVNVTAAAAAEARQRLGLSQSQFAGMLGVSVRTFQEWEQGRAMPNAQAAVLIKFVEKYPDTVERLATV